MSIFIGLVAIEQFQVHGRFIMQEHPWGIYPSATSAWAFSEANEVQPCSTKFVKLPASLDKSCASKSRQVYHCGSIHIYQQHGSINQYSHVFSCIPPTSQSLLLRICQAQLVGSYAVSRRTVDLCGSKRIAMVLFPNRHKLWSVFKRESNSFGGVTALVHRARVNQQLDD